MSCLSCFLVEFLKEMVRMEIYIYIHGKWKEEKSWRFEC